MASRSKVRSTMFFTCSGSVLSERRVNPTRSAKTTVATRRSSPRETRAWPHDGQNRAPAGASAPQDGQGIAESYDGRDNAETCPSAPEFERPKSSRRSLIAVRNRLDDATISSRLAGLPGWGRDADEIVREFECPGFPAAIAFVVRIGFLAEAKDHHPDLDIRWRRVRVVLTTHDVGGLSDWDFELAAAIDEVAP